MELINRTDAIKAMDELEQEDIEKYGCSIPEGFDGERARLAICLLPTIQAVPIEVLQEIKQDISLLEDHVQTDAHTITAYNWKGMQDKVLEIIDRHIKEYTNETDN